MYSPVAIFGFRPSVKFLSFSESDPSIGLWTKVSYNFLIFEYLAFMNNYEISRYNAMR